MRWHFVLSQVGSGLRRNLAMATAVVIVTFVSLIFVGAAALLQIQVENMKGEWYDKVEVAVYMCPTGSAVPNCAAGKATEDQLNSVEETLGSTELAAYVQEVYLETPDEALANLREIVDAPWVESVTADQMQYSYRVKLVDPEQYEVIADELSGVAGVERVLDQREMLEPMFRVLNQATLLSIGFGLIMVVAAILLITTTIRLSALSRKRETSIMRLVGASNAFIQMPFLIEGAVAAVTGAGLAVLGLWLGVRYFVEGWLAQGSTLMYVGTADVLMVAPFLVVAAILLAGISSLVTLGRYTKV